MEPTSSPLAAAAGAESRAARPQGWGQKLVLALLFLSFVASFFAYSRRAGDFAGYAMAGNAVLTGKDLYLGNLFATNTWPPFFSLLSVPLALLDHVSSYFVRVLWVALTWACLFWSLDLTAQMVYGKRLRIIASDESSLAIASPEILAPFVLTLPYILNNFELLQINVLLFALVLWGLFLQSKGRETAGGLAIALAAAMKVMAVAFLPYLLYRKRWRASFWLAAGTVALSLSPVIVFGWKKFWAEVALWPASLHASWGSGNAQQSVYAMWDRILGYGYMPFAVPGTFQLPLSGSHGAKAAWLFTCALVAVLGALAFRGAPQPASRWAHAEWAAVFVAATILSPLTRKPYLIVLLLPNALLYAAWRAAGVGTRLRRISGSVLLAAFLLSVPTLHDLIGKSLAVRLEMGSIATYGALIMLGGMLWYRWRGPELQSKAES